MSNMSNVLPLEKISAIGGDQEASFEQAFATLAFQYISDKAPRLMDHLVGFQLVERNDDNTRAVGIFGFQLGKQWIYVPVFFMNGDLKGHELMYLKSQNQFVPLKEPWVNYVMAKRPHVLGENESQTLQQLGVMQPDLTQLSVPPGRSKFSSVTVDIPEGVADWAIPTLPWIYKTALRNPYKGAEDLLPKMISESFSLCKAAMTVRRLYPDLAKAMDNLYGKDVLAAAVISLRDKIATETKSAILRDDMPSSSPDGVFSILHGFLRRKKTAFEKVSITVDEDQVITHNAPELTEQEQERLLRDGHLIRDDRNGEEVSRAYNVQVEIELTNPDCTNVFDVLTKPGDFSRCLVISHPYSPERRERFCTLVRLEPKNWANIDRSFIFVKPNTDNEVTTFNDWFEDLSSAKLSKGGMYVIVCPDGTGTVPFEIQEDVGENRYRIWCRTWGARRPKWLPAVAEREHSPWDDYDCCCGDQYIEISTRPGTKMRAVHGCMYIPENAKVIEVKPPPKPRKEDKNDCCCAPCCPEAESKNPPIEPGNIADVQLGLIQKMSSLKLYVNGGEISIDRGPLKPKRAALFELVQKYGFREKTAKLLLSEAERARARGQAARFIVKYAQGYPLVQEAPTAPSIPDPMMTMDGAYASVPAHYPEQMDVPVDGMSAGQTDPSVYDTSPDAMPDPMSMQQAQQAAQTGQKEVFDTSMINGLLRTVRQDSLVERYMGDLLKALDRLGRMLFIFYWHNDKFSERYGQSDMPELEDSLRDTFESLGDLTLFLKEKDVAPLPGAEMGEPEIDETME